MNNIEEAKRCLKCKNAKCTANCPVLTNIPEAVRLYEEGKLDEAGELLFNNNPLSLICSIVCPHERNCAGHCARGIKGEPVKWYEIERDISRRFLNRFKPIVPPYNGHRVAVIGAGPSGITMSLLLAQKGYKVTLIDNHGKIGGIMRYGIPEFRLPKYYIDRIYEILCDYGVQFKPNVFIGSNTTIDDMLIDGYSAIFVAVGTSRPNKIGLLGESLGNCHFAIDYLASPSSYQPVDNVVVIGVGNVAVDAARTAIFSGASNVTMLNNRRDCDITCDKKELQAALSEGVKLQNLVSTIKITEDEVVCAEVDLIEGADAEVTFEENFSKIKTFKAERTIIAIGQGPQAAAIQGTNIEKNKRGLYQTDENGRTQKTGVFAAGDVVTGPRTVVEAIAFTKKVEKALDEYCMSLG